MWRLLGPSLTGLDLKVHQAIVAFAADAAPKEPRKVIQLAKLVDGMAVVPAVAEHLRVSEVEVEAAIVSMLDVMRRYVDHGRQDFVDGVEAALIGTREDQRT